MLTIKQAAAVYLRIVDPGNRVVIKLNNDVGHHAPFSRVRADLLAAAGAARLIIKQFDAVRWPAKVQPWITAMAQTFEQANIRCFEEEAASRSLARYATVTKESEDCTASSNVTDPNQIRSLLGLPPIH